MSMHPPQDTVKPIEESPPSVNTELKAPAEPQPVQANISDKVESSPLLNKAALEEAKETGEIVKAPSLETVEGKIEASSESVEDRAALGENKPQGSGEPGQQPQGRHSAKSSNSPVEKIDSAPDCTAAITNGSLNENRVVNDTVEPQVNGHPPNEGTARQPEEPPENEGGNAHPEHINIQELTEHVMNIINSGVADHLMSEQQLMEKNIELQQFVVKLIRLLKEKTDLCANLDRQNSALISQAQSLKDVIAITKDLLGIRNMEIEHLHADLAAMEDSIKEERTRHNLSVQHLNEAMSLNEKLKTEYLTQMDLFQKLRDKYNEKVVYLTRENQRLNGLINPDGNIPEGLGEEADVSNTDSQSESVDK